MPQQNMVGPGEVDEDLQPETTEECSKYGEVSNCLVYEVYSHIIAGRYITAACTHKGNQFLLFIYRSLKE